MVKLSKLIEKEGENEFVYAVIEKTDLKRRLNSSRKAPILSYTSNQFTPSHNKKLRKLLSLSGSRLD